MDHHDLEAKAAALAEKNRRTERRQWSEAENSAALARAKETHEDPEKLDMLKSAFELFDLDGGGSIEVNELHVLLEGLGIKLSREEALDLVHEVPACPTQARHDSGLTTRVGAVRWTTTAAGWWNSRNLWS